MQKYRTPNECGTPILRDIAIPLCWLHPQSAASRRRTVDLGPRVIISRCLGEYPLRVL